MKSSVSIFVSLLLSAATGFPQENDLSMILKPGATLEKLSGNFNFTEGPAADAKGNVYFTDQPNDRIMVWSTKGVLSTFMQPSGRSNGLFFDRQGYLWSCADEKNELWKIGMDKTVEVIVELYSGKLLNGPNDLWIAPDGAIYFTDPFYRRSWWDHKSMQQDKQCVYYLAPDHKTLRRVAEDLVQPNGIIGTADGKTLYVADIGNKKTWSYMVNSDGSLVDKKLFCEMGSDGMTIDKKGNIYITGRGVTIFDKTGKQIGNIAVPEDWTANVTFGDRDRKSLYITASKGLYRIRTRIKGVY
ncbi:MAG: SMP-30/gluconolactonase/LRE family protein [Bacteroidales bacterium]|nr:SMP-30/gluconolactonase/LRE family protein [Bacteroidales bacterium]